jgi:hypothetical protein
MKDGDKLDKDFKRRLSDAREQKRRIELDMREAYFFVDPHRCRDLSSMTRPTEPESSQASEASTSLGMEVGQEFAGYLLDTFMPSTLEWANQKTGTGLPSPDALPEGAIEELQQNILLDTRLIFDTMKSSGFYSSAAQAFWPDACLGTVAMWIGQPRASDPVMTIPVPLRELEINVGPYGDVDDRFMVRHTRFGDLMALLPGVKLPDEVRRKVENSPQGRCIVTWGWWRLWDRDDDCWWQAVVYADGKRVAEGELKGHGACPLVVGRFDPDPMFAFGRGPTIKSLPELRRLDEVEALKIENFDFQVHPPFGFPDDGIINLSGGIEPGMGYPMRPGSGRDITKLSFEGNVDFTTFEIAKVEERIRRLHFVDFAQQKGKTPPTAQQWLDEMMMAQQRIGTPGLTFWKEVPMEVFRRFRWLLQKDGKIPEGYNLNGLQVTLVPYNPTEAAQDNQKVAMATRLVEIGRTAFPQTFEAICDQAATLKNIKEKMRDELVVFRDQKGIGQAIDQFGSLLGGGGAPGAMPGVPAGVPGLPPEGAV